MEQHWPRYQSPQTVFPFALPQVPSVVTAPVCSLAGTEEVAADITGSLLVALEAAADDPELAVFAVVGGAVDPVPEASMASVQPLWHPFSTRQC